MPIFFIGFFAVGKNLADLSDFLWLGSRSTHYTERLWTTWHV